MSDALMMSSRPNTNFKKICFNPSWDNNGLGLFFTSNRQVFNNIFYLNLSTRKISTVANYKGSNLSAVQNPRTGQIAMILSGKSNPDVWIAANSNSKPKQLTKIKAMNLVLVGHLTGVGYWSHLIVGVNLNCMKFHFPRVSYREFLRMLVRTVWKHHGIHWTKQKLHLQQLFPRISNF